MAQHVLQHGDMQILVDRTIVQAILKYLLTLTIRDICVYIYIKKKKKTRELSFHRYISIYRSAFRSSSYCDKQIHSLIWRGNYFNGYSTSGWS